MREAASSQGIIYYFTLSKNVFHLLVLICFASTFGHSQNIRKFTLSGYVREAGSLETLPGVSIAIREINTGTYSNTYGFYSLTLPPKDTLILLFSCLGYQSQEIKTTFTKGVDLDVELLPNNEMMQEVEIYAKEDLESRSAQMSIVKIPVSQMKNVPGLLGEKDMLKVLQLMPGVQKGREGNSGLYVRGGGPDQNLIILDDAIVYNAFHLFGFYSLFNGDALKSIELTKGGFPARFGGRLSSVVEMNMKEGNKEKLHGEAGIGIISSKLTLEGPLVKNKSSFLFSARRTYLDLLVTPFLDKDRKVSYYFYDMNAKVNYDLNNKNKIYLSSYLGKDKFSGIDKSENLTWKANLQWGNVTATARWNHLFSNKIFSNTSLVFSRYKLKGSERNEGNYFMTEGGFNSFIRDIAVKSDLDIHVHSKHMIKAGISLIHHTYNPTATSYINRAAPQENNATGSIVNAVETGIYAEDTYKPLSFLSINAGIRLSSYSLSDKTYIKPEPRLTTAFHLTDNFSLKGAYSVMNQYIHMLSYTKIGLPNDLWVPATKKVLPQRSEQLALGIARDLPQQNLYVTLEGYYKTNKNVIAYKNGANYLNLDEDIDESWEDKVTRGKGWSYGMEFLLHRKYGKISGWIGYTLSWSWLQFDSINSGKKYYASYDRRHDASLVIIYKPNSKITFSTTWVYGTGNRITLPVGMYSSNNSRNDRTLFTDKNGYIMPAYHRWDAGIQFHKQKKNGLERTWEISVYNFYNRKNPYFYFITASRQMVQGSYRNQKLRQITLFPVLPSVSYKIKF